MEVPSGGSLHAASSNVEGCVGEPDVYPVYMVMMCILYTW